MTYQQGETLIYDNIYPVRFEKRQDATLAVVSEDGAHFFARWDMLRRPMYRSRYMCNHPKVDDSGICNVCRAAE